MKLHFVYCHVWYTVVIVEEDNPPHPKFPCYGMMVMWAALNGRQLKKYQCDKGAERNQFSMAAEESQAGTDGFQSVWTPAHKCGISQIPWPHPHGHGRKLTGGIVQYEEFQEEVGADFQDTWARGGECVDIR